MTFFLTQKYVNNSYFYRVAHKLVEDKLTIPYYLTVNLIYDKTNEHVEKNNVVSNSEAIEKLDEANGNQNKVNNYDETTTGLVFILRINKKIHLVFILQLIYHYRSIKKNVKV